MHYMLHSVTAVALKSWMRCVRECNNLSPRHTSSEAATLPLQVTPSPRPLQVGHTPLHTEAWRGLTSIVSLLIAVPHKDFILRSRVRGCVVGSLCVGLQFVRGGVRRQGWDKVYRAPPMLPSSSSPHLTMSLPSPMHCSGALHPFTGRLCLATPLS